MKGSVRPLVLLVLCSPLGAQVAGLDANGDPLSLPYHDVRKVEGIVLPAVRGAIADARTDAQREARAADLADLAERVPELRLQEDDVFGTPHFLRSTRALLTAPRFGPFAPRDVVRDFVAEHEALFEVPARELDVARVSREFRTKHNGVTHLTFQQQIGGVDLWGAELKANVSARGELINVSSTLVPRPTGGFEVPAPVLGPLGALRAAAASVGIAMTRDPAPVGRAVGASGRQTWTSTPDFRADVPITTELVYFPLTRTEVRTGWSVVVPEPGVGNTYETIVDAVDGTILRRWNRLHFLASTESVDYRIFVEDSPAPGSPGTATPDGTQFPLVPRTLVTVPPSEVVAFSPDGWIDDGMNETFGNNVDAHTDLDADNLPDLPRPAGSPYRVFDFPLDLAMPPSTYTDAAVTQLFYDCNLFHDVLYELGWDEAASNYQDDNFGRGGVGGDRLGADAQDGSDVNNARFFGSGGDGTSGRIEMYVFDGPDPDRDGDFDSDVVYHEYAHGLSIRLSGGTVFGDQAGGMGEGWGDYFGVSINAEPGDDPHGVFPMGPYVTYQLAGVVDNYYFGIRRYPYSTDLSKSPLTYEDIDPNQIVIPPGVPMNIIGSPTANEVHNVGEIWCQALLECRANLWDVMGFPANELMMQLVVDGLKLMPSTPNMLEARDAILQADIVNDGGANLGELWAGFAKRGMGGSATSPSGSTAVGVVAAFDVPTLIEFTFPSGTPSQLMPGTATTFPVEVAGFGGDVPTPGSGTLSYSVDGAPFVTIPMTDTGGDTYEAELPAFACLSDVDFYLTVDSNRGPVTSPANAPADTFSAEVFSSIATLIEDDLDPALPGWSVGDVDDTATTGVWEIGDPNGTSAQPEDDHTADPATDCFFTGQGTPGGSLGEADVDGGKTTLFSPVLDLSAGDARIGYWRWYSNDTGATPNTDVFRVDVTNDGGANWVNVETVGPAGEGTSGGWVQHTFTVSDFVAPNASIQLRFVAADDGDGSLVEAAIDDLSVFELECATNCQPDLGFGGPGSLALSVCGAPLATGNVADLAVTGAQPGATLFFFLGLASNPSPFKGGTLVPVPVLTVVTLAADGAGQFLGGVPGGGGPGSVFLQVVSPDGAQPKGFAISNAVELVFEP